MSIVPRHTIPAVYIDPPGEGFGSLLSVLTLGLIKDPATPAPLTQDEIEGQIATVVSQQLLSQGMSAPVDKIKEAAGYLMNQYDSWGTVLTDPNQVINIRDQTIQALLASNLVTGASGTVAAGVPVTAAGTVVTPPTPPIVVSPEVLAIAGAGFLGVLLLFGRHNHDVKRR